MTPKTKARWQRAATAMLGLVVLAVSWIPEPSPAVAAEAIDPASRESVASAYLNWYLPTQATNIAWSGNPNSCIAGQPQSQPATASGSPSSEVQTATFSAINYFRAMAGLSGVTEDVTGSTLAQQAALMIAANGALSHYPPTDWRCYSIDGAAASGTSNLAFGQGGNGAGARAIAQYMDDEGVPSVGHRRWVLYPPLSQAGSGSTTWTNALKVGGEGTAATNPRPAQGTPWPSAGYFPAELAPSSQWWSYSAPNLDFSNSSVSVTRNGFPVNTTVINKGAGGGDPSVVWQMPNIEIPIGTAEDLYEVTISGVAPAPIVYTVKIFRATPIKTPPQTNQPPANDPAATLDPTKPRIKGKAKVGRILRAVTGTWKPTPVVLSLQWKRNERVIAKATKTSYKLTKADRGNRITLTVTGTKADYPVQSLTSKATKKVVR